MIDTPIWYTCCVGHVTSDGTTTGKPTWDIGIMPTYNGKVSGRIDADTFRIWKGTKYPQEAYNAMLYLETQGVQQLVVGTADQPSAYGAFPARTSMQAAWLAAKQQQFPGVQNWNTFIAGLSYPDVPSAEAYMPNFNKSFADAKTFYSLILNGQNNGPFDLNAAMQSFLGTLQSDFSAQQ